MECLGYLPFYLCGDRGHGLWQKGTGLPFSGHMLVSGSVSDYHSSTRVGQAPALRNPRASPASAQQWGCVRPRCEWGERVQLLPVTDLGCNS